MASVTVVSAEGKKVAERQLAPEVFEAKVSIPLMHQVVVAGAAAARRGTHKAKTRGDVSGGGKKPWRQKGTGRARQGSTRAPQWTGGGVVHGPQPRDHSMRVNKKMKRGALRSALTDAVQSGKLVVIDDFGFDAPKTKGAVALLDRLEARQGKILVVVPSPTADGSVEKSFRNISGVRVAYAGALGVYEVLAADRIVVSSRTLDVLEGKDGATAHPAATDAPTARPAAEDAPTTPPADGDADGAEPTEDVPAEDQEVGE
jgi:large subunit ribosomal protein L4